MIKPKYDHYKNELAVGDYVIYPSAVWNGGSRADVKVGIISSIKGGIVNIQGEYRGFRSTYRLRKVSAKFAKEWETGKILNA